jgi:hypothetical protein
MTRLVVIAVAALALAPQALAAPEPKHVKPDRAAITKLLDEFIPAVVRQQDLKRGWQLSAGVARTTPYRDWLRGDTSVQTYPARGTHFPGWLVNYSYPGDVGFDILLQPQKKVAKTIGAWSFRAEAQKIDGAWRITTWYPVATFAPPGQTATVLGPNDIGAGDSAASGSVTKGRLGSWVLFIPAFVVAGIALGGVAYAGVRWARQRSRVAEIRRSLAQ